MKCHVNTTKAIVGLLSGLMFLTLGAVALHLRLFVFAAITLVLSCIYLFLALRNGDTLLLSSDGISRLSFGRERAHWNWESIQEYGVIGLRLFGSEKAIENGTKYVYFSETPMDDDQRFQMALKWPPKKCAYALYSDELLHNAKLRLDLEPVYFNTSEP